MILIIILSVEKSRSTKVPLSILSTEALTVPRFSGVSTNEINILDMSWIFRHGWEGVMEFSLIEIATPRRCTQGNFEQQMCLECVFSKSCFIIRFIRFQSRATADLKFISFLQYEVHSRPAPSEEFTVLVAHSLKFAISFKFHSQGPHLFDALALYDQCMKYPLSLLGSDNHL